MSDWKKGAAARRDARATKTEDMRPSSASTKDTKRWCKGKSGREHQMKCFDLPCFGNVRRYVLACAVCGREFAYWWPSLFAGPKPDWVTEKT